MSLALALLEELGGEAGTEAVGHHALDRAADDILRVALTIDELDRHALVLSGGFVHDALDLAVNGERQIAAGNEELEQEFGSDREGPLGLDEGAAARDVLGVVGEERIEALVLDLELDRPARLGAAISCRIVGHG